MKVLNLENQCSDCAVANDAGETDLSILDDLDALQRDPATAELIRSGRTMGCFYIESPSMRSLFHRMRCECYEDVVAASSIIRPGVAESGMMNEYVRRRYRAMRGEKIFDFRFPIFDFGLETVGGSDKKQDAENPRQATEQVANLCFVSGPKSKIQNRKSKIECRELAELLAETYGVMVYQEDVIKVVHELGGLSLGEADILRRAMSGKAGGREAMESLTERFFAGCRARGVPEPVIEELWRQIETLARFSFCKGHSAAFAVLSYQVAYLKAHYPAEFMAAVLANGGGFYGAAAYVQECRRMGMRVLGPDVNESEVAYIGKTKGRGERQEARENSSSSVRVPPLAFGGPCLFSSPENSTLKIQNSKLLFGFVRVGFAAIKNFPLDLAERIVRLRRKRPFDGLENFLRRVRPGHEAAEKLIRVGAFDRFGIPRERLFLESDIYFRERADDNESGAGWQPACAFSSIAQVDNLRHSPFASAPASRFPPPIPRVEDEIELLGYGVSAHPLELLPPEAWRGTVAARDLGRHVGRRVTMIGWLIASKLLRTHKTREFMKFLSLEDLTDTFEVTLFPRAYRRFAPLTLSTGPFRIRGKVENEQGALSLVADHIEMISDLSTPSTAPP
jgi:DNA polymerase III alpha subunit